MKEELNLGELFDRFIRFIRRNLTFLLVFIVLCISIASAVFFLKPKTYKSQAICSSYIAQFEYNNEGQRSAVDAINFLNTFLDNNDYLGFSEVLDIPIEDAYEFKSMQAETKYKINMDEKLVEINKFEINLEVFSPSKIIVLEDALLNYFNNNDYFQFIKKKYRTGKKLFLSTAIQEMADFRNNRLNRLHQEIGVSTEVQADQNQVLNIARNIESASYIIDVADSFIYIEKFSKPQKRSESFAYWLGMSFLISLLFGLTVVRIKEVKSK